MNRFSVRLLFAKLLAIIVGLVGRARLRVGRLRPPFLRRRSTAGIQTPIDASARQANPSGCEASVAQPSDEPLSTYREKEGRAHRRGSRTTNRRRQAHGRPNGRKPGARKRMRLAKEKDRNRARTKAAPGTSLQDRDSSGMSPAAQAWHGCLSGLVPNAEHVSNMLGSDPERFPPPEPAASGA